MSPSAVPVGLFTEPADVPTVTLLLDALNAIVEAAVAVSGRPPAIIPEIMLRYRKGSTDLLPCA